MYGEGGDDEIHGDDNGSSEEVRGNDGDDYVNGGIGYESIYGGGGEDTCADSTGGELIDEASCEHIQTFP
jgi:hypothetical protein